MGDKLKRSNLVVIPFDKSMTYVRVGAEAYPKVSIKENGKPPTFKINIHGVRI